MDYHVLSLFSSQVIALNFVQGVGLDDPMNLFQFYSSMILDELPFNHCSLEYRNKFLNAFLIKAHSIK